VSPVKSMGSWDVGVGYLSVFLRSGASSPSFFHTYSWKAFPSALLALISDDLSAPSFLRRHLWPTDGCERVGTWNRRSTMLISADSNRTSRSDRSLPPTRSALSQEPHSAVEDLSGTVAPTRSHPCFQTTLRSVTAPQTKPESSRGHADDRLVGALPGDERAVGGARTTLRRPGVGRHISWRCTPAPWPSSSSARNSSLLWALRSTAGCGRRRAARPRSTTWSPLADAPPPSR